jgi:hypothetical protein
MNDPTTTSPSPLHIDMQQERDGEAQRLAVCAGVGEEASRAIGRASRLNHGDYESQGERSKCTRGEE